MENSSRVWIDRARTGDGAAIDALLEEHLPGLRAYIRLTAGRAVRAKEDVSDVAQSVCRQVLEGLDDFEYRGEAAFRQWLFTMAKRKIIQRDRYFRTQKRDIDREVRALDGRGEAKLFALYSSICSPSRQASMRENIESLEAAFERLPEHYRQVLIEAVVIQRPIGDIASDLGRTPEAARKLLARAKIRVAQLMDRQKPDV